MTREDNALSSDDSPEPWRISDEDWEGDGAAYVSICDANGESVAAVNSWSRFDRGLPSKATARDWAIARKVVAIVNAHASRQRISGSMTLTERFRRLIDAKGLSIAGLADTAGMERQQVHRVVTGKVLNPGILTVQRIVEAAGATMGEFFADED